MSNLANVHLQSTIDQRVLNLKVFRLPVVSGPIHGVLYKNLANLVKPSYEDPDNGNHP